MNNLELWQSVSETPPEWVKPLPHKPSLSSVNAYYQLEQMTDQFGPVGKGWGYTIDELKIGKEFVLCKLSTWYTLEGVCYKIPQVIKMQALRQGKQHKFDEDACAKCITAALTKSLSLLGFSADVFQGRHDKVPSNREQAINYAHEMYTGTNDIY